MSVGIVLFGVEFLRESLPSLVKQDYEDIEFLLRDHSPHAEAQKFIEKELPELAKKVKIETGKNILHSGGMNALLRHASGKYFIAASADVLYPPDFVSRAVAELERPGNSEFGSVAVKLKKWDFAGRGKTDTLDSCGIGITYTHKFFDRGQGARDRGQFDARREVFGASAALAVFRREALTEVAADGKIFDERLHFKNDADLAYRLQLLGKKCLFLPDVVAWHARGLGRGKPREKRSNFEKENSAFGQFVAVEKNFANGFSWRVRLLTRLRLLALRLFGIIFEKSVRNAFRKFEKIRAELKKSPQKVAAAEIEKLME